MIVMQQVAQVAGRYMVDSRAGLWPTELGPTSATVAQEDVK